jgi:hypothetical protein
MDQLIRVRKEVTPIGSSKARPETIYWPESPQAKRLALLLDRGWLYPDDINFADKMGFIIEILQPMPALHAEMNMTDTPRCDEIQDNAGFPLMTEDAASGYEALARTLERELASAVPREWLEDMRKQWEKEKLRADRLSNALSNIETIIDGKADASVEDGRYECNDYMSIQNEIDGARK